MQKISIPRAFLEDNYDMDLVMKNGLHLQVQPEGHDLDTDIDDMFLYRYQVGPDLCTRKIRSMQFLMKTGLFIGLLWYGISLLA